MRFMDLSGRPVSDAAAFKAEYKAAERLFAARFGTAHLFISRLLSARALPYAKLRQAFLQMEYVDCPTSEFPAENYIYWVSFVADAETTLQIKLDSYTKARRILERLRAFAPQAEIRIPPAPPKLL